MGLLANRQGKVLDYGKLSALNISVCVKERGSIYTKKRARKRRVKTFASWEDSSVMIEN